MKSESVFDAKQAEELLEALYRPGSYEEGEKLCLEILEERAPEWEPARLYLLLNLAAQDFEEEALQVVDDLSNDLLFEALGHLAFGAGTATEEFVYEDIVACLKSRGQDEQLEHYFSTLETPPPKPNSHSNLSALG